MSQRTNSLTLSQSIRPRMSTLQAQPRFLVAESVPEGVNLSLRDGDDVVQGCMASWALRTGQQHHYVMASLPETMRHYQASSGSDRSATYIITFEAAVDLIRAGLGPTDRERYELALHARRERTHALIAKSAVVVVLAAAAALALPYAAMRVLVFVVVFPLVIAFFLRRP
jgi:hypothetical protein